MNNKVKELRSQFNLSQANLAQLVGVSRQTINSLETGRYNPSIILAYKISRVFKLNVEEVFIYEEEDNEKK